MATSTAPEVRPALLFMPDISGFTKFVNETEILHSQHIIQELLEILIDSNEIGLKVNEVEGDAILFYRTGKKPSLGELTKQVEKMYFNFHQHLKLYDHQRVCPCGACKSAINLQLKVITHYGEVAEYMLKDHKKLFGKDVIVIHRLLKNDIDHHEYILLTDSVVQDQKEGNYPDWFVMNERSGVYDSGEIKYAYSELTELKDKVPPPNLPHYNLSSKCVAAFELETVIHAEMEKIFDAFFDLQKRVDWGEGVKGIEMLNHDKINRIGAEHRCIVKPKNNPVIITESVDLSKEKIVMVEMDKKGMGGTRVTLIRNVNSTLVKVEVLVRNNPFIKLMFNMMMKKKYRDAYKKSFVNLDKYLNEKELKPNKNAVEPELAMAAS